MSLDKHHRYLPGLAIYADVSLEFSLMGIENRVQLKASRIKNDTNNGEQARVGGASIAYPRERRMIDHLVQEID